MKKAISVLAALIMAASAMATTSYAETIHDDIVNITLHIFSKITSSDENPHSHVA